MQLKYLGGDTDFMATVFSEPGFFKAIKSARIVYKTESTQTVIQGSGFTTENEGSPGLTGTVTAINFNQGTKNVAVAKLSGLSVPMSTMLPALLAVDGGDFSGVNAILSAGKLNIRALSAFDGLELEPGLKLDGGVNLAGSKFADVVATGAGNDKLVGRNGEDELSGGGGNDKLVGGSGNDDLDGGAGNDVINGGAGNDIMNGGAGKDKMDGKGGSDNMNGGGGADDMNGGTGGDIMNGGAGNDTMNGQAGDDIMNGGTGDDEMDGLAGVDVINGDGGNDVIRAGDGNDEVYGGAGNDLLGGGTGADVIEGGTGNDFIIGGGQADTIFGGSGADQFIFTAASDSGLGKFADVIEDFEVGVDFVDLAALELAFVEGKFSGEGAEVRLVDNGTGTFVQVDSDGDGKADMGIVLAGITGEPAASVDDLVL